MNWFGDLVIHGNNNANSVTVNYQTLSGVGYYKVTENGVNSWIKASRVWGGDVLFYGYGGNDFFNNNTSLGTFAYGHDGNDSLYGGSSTDYLYGGNGSDLLYGKTGWDYLYGQAGNDTLNGGDDGYTDYLHGGTGQDLFQQDWYWIGSLRFNSDTKADYFSGWDKVYG